MLPPRVASVQVIVIPIRNSKSSQEDSDALTSKAESIVKDLQAKGIRVKSDIRDIYTPGWKYNHWETKATLNTILLESTEFLSLFDESFVAKKQSD